MISWASFRCFPSQFGHEMLNERVPENSCIVKCNEWKRVFSQVLISGRDGDCCYSRVPSPKLFQLKSKTNFLYKKKKKYF